jgi:hypothetical protein
MTATPTLAASTNAFITSEQAASDAGVSVYTINKWCRKYGSAYGGDGFRTRDMRCGRKIHACDFQRWLEKEGPLHG